MSKKFSVPLTSESVTSGQAGGVFRQFFLQCMFARILMVQLAKLHQYIGATDIVTPLYYGTAPVAPTDKETLTSCES
jgi:hypothetical protein